VLLSHRCKTANTDNRVSHFQGKYTVQADVYSKDDEHITCLTAVVFFNRKPFGGFLDLDL
jgi:hypothetical protein